MTVQRAIVAALAAMVMASAGPAFAQGQMRYVKYETGGRASWGIFENNDTTIRELQGNPFDGSAKPTGKTLKAAEVKYLAPAEAKKVVAAGLNYKSHIGDSSPAKYVGLFASSRPRSPATSSRSSIRLTPASCTTRRRSAW